MNSGYVMIDFGGLNILSESKVTVSGIVDQVKAALKTGKPIIAGGLKVGTKECAPVSVLVCQDGTTATSYDVFLSIYEIVVDKDNGCTITDLTAST